MGNYNSQITGVDLKLCHSWHRENRKTRPNIHNPFKSQSNWTSSYTTSIHLPKVLPFERYHINNASEDRGSPLATEFTQHRTSIPVHETQPGMSIKSSLCFHVLHFLYSMYQPQKIFLLYRINNTMNNYNFFIPKPCKIKGTHITPPPLFTNSMHFM